MNDPVITQLFDEAWNETANARSSVDLELDQLLMRDFSAEREEFQILFELADEAITSKKLRQMSPSYYALAN